MSKEPESFSEAFDDLVDALVELRDAIANESGLVEFLSFITEKLSND